MRQPPGLTKATCALLLSAVAGCVASGGASVRADATCPDLNAAIGATSKEISAAAVSRGRIERANVPFWVPGGKQAVTALKDRQTRRIAALEDRLDAATAARRARCTRP